MPQCLLHVCENYYTLGLPCYHRDFRLGLFVPGIPALLDSEMFDRSDCLLSILPRFRKS